MDVSDAEYGRLSRGLVLLHHFLQLGYRRLLLYQSDRGDREAKLTTDKVHRVQVSVGSLQKDPSWCIE